MTRYHIARLPQEVGNQIKIFGRIQTLRDHGKLLFIDMADETGIVQCVSRQKFDINPCDVLEIQGTVKKRPENLVNKNIPTGEIEIEITKLIVISKSKTPPIPTETDGRDIEEELRLKYRYLDLRRERLQKNIRLRSQIAAKIREYLYKEDFCEIETPYLSKTTPEGARDFLVPARLSPGKFYALAQAPQQYKQLLMLAGFEKYFQIARAFRDEDMRKDRQFEHTQIDLEMAYITREDVLTLVEKMMINLAQSLKRKILKTPFPVFTYEEAMKKFKNDRFDLRNIKDRDTLAFAWVVDFPLFEYDSGEKHYTFSHNPFTAPKEEAIEDLVKLKNLDKLPSYQYDLILNGEELGSGSIRITNPKIQRQVFKIMGLTDKKIEDDFGHLLRAYEFGAPPHGGIALGLDRLCAILSGEKNIREVIAFPISGSGQTAVMDAPTQIDQKILSEYKLKKL